MLVRGNTIAAISNDPIAAGASATVIAGGGRTLMPGLIDVHWHTMLVRPTPAALLVDDVGYLNLVAGAEAERHADARVHHRARSGRSVVRAEAGHRRGTSIAGPRIYPSGAMITITSGHGDFRHGSKCRASSARRCHAGADRRRHGRRQSR